MGKKRKTSDAKKNLRAASYARSQERKKARREEQERRAAANRERRASGELTPWEEAKAKRSARVTTKG